MIHIITVGKRHEDWVKIGIERYQKRLRAPWNIQWILLPHSAKHGLPAREHESHDINKALVRLRGAFTILLDETGRQYSSPGLQAMLLEQIEASRDVVIVIGGAYGVTADLHNQVDKVISFGELVYPHQLVRLLLVEQLYRSQEIANGGKYHHE